MVHNSTSFPSQLWLIDKWVPISVGVKHHSCDRPSQPTVGNRAWADLGISRSGDMALWQVDEPTRGWYYFYLNLFCLSFIIFFIHILPLKVSLTFSFYIHHLFLSWFRSNEHAHFLGMVACTPLSFETALTLFFMYYLQNCNFQPQPFRLAKRAGMPGSIGKLVTHCKRRKKMWTLINQCTKYI